MSMSLGQWLAHAYIVRRNAYAAGAVVFIGGLLLWTLWTWPAERVSMQQVYAEVESLSPAEPPPSDMRNKPLTVIIVRMPDQRRVRLVLDDHTRPQVGSRVPVTYELYADDSETFFFNRQRWLEDGGR